MSALPANRILRTQKAHALTPQSRSTSRLVLGPVLDHFGTTQSIGSLAERQGHVSLTGVPEGLSRTGLNPKSMEYLTPHPPEGSPADSNSTVAFRRVSRTTTCWEYPSLFVGITPPSARWCAPNAVHRLPFPASVVNTAAGWQLAFGREGRSYRSTLRVDAMALNDHVSPLTCGAHTSGDLGAIRPTSGINTRPPNSAENLNRPAIFVSS